MGKKRGGAIKLERLEFALNKYQQYNRLRNDLDAYLDSLARWAMGIDKNKPNPSDYGVDD